MYSIICNSYHVTLPLPFSGQHPIHNMINEVISMAFSSPDSCVPSRGARVNTGIIIAQFVYEKKAIAVYCFMQCLKV